MSHSPDCQCERCLYISTEEKEAIRDRFRVEFPDSALKPKELGNDVMVQALREILERQNYDKS